MLRAGLLYKKNINLIFDMIIRYYFNKYIYFNQSRFDLVRVKLKQIQNIKKKIFDIKEKIKLR